MKVVVTGMIATYPLGGVAWDYGQYLIGLEKLGFDVYYLEDTTLPLYDPVTGIENEDGISFLKESLSRLSPSLENKWHVRLIDGRTFGLSQERMKLIISSADLFINVSGGTVLRDEYMESACKVLIDTDPGWNHFVTYPKWDASPGWQNTNGWRAHDFFFTYAENIGNKKCMLPALGVQWLKTRPPVSLNCWVNDEFGKKWTTVMSWKSHVEPIIYNNRKFGGKEDEFNKIEKLPKLNGSSFEVALGGINPPINHIENLGWSVVSSVDQSKTMDIYRRYIQQSRGEFSIAKNVYVDTYSGWFSCRSVCYLAASRPVVVQDTGFSRFIPTGEGLFSFASVDEAKLAIETIEKNYTKHQKAARDIAEEYFDASKVINKMLKDIGFF